ncbi:MAG: CapA family protein [Bacteroidales bacterium]|nr:CapA family protein [Bacteroidales bacterium]
MIYLQTVHRPDNVKKTILSISALLCLCAIASAQAKLVTSITYDSIAVNISREEVLPLDTVCVTIVGDLMMHSAQIDNCYGRYLRAARATGATSAAETTRNDPSHYDFTPCLEGIRDILSGADICIANMEFTHAGAPYRGYPSFSAPDSYSQYAADCGVDVFLMANNHILDGGSAGVLRTIGVYEAMDGVRYTGCFADEEALRGGWPLILECRGLRIAVVNFTYGTNVEPTSDWPKVCTEDREEIAAALRTARDSADIVLVIPHWGIEYRLHHSPAQQDLADFLLRHGADAVIGGHPHVVQDIETRDRFPDKSAPVVYSMGNILSNMSAPDTQIGLIVTLPLVRYADGSTRVATPKYDLTWCSLPGGLNGSHATIPVRDWIGRRSEWTRPADYDKMINTYNKILYTSGIVDTQTRDSDD